MREDLKLWRRHLLEAGYFHFRVIYIGTLGTSGDYRRTLDFNIEQILRYHIAYRL